MPMGVRHEHETYARAVDGIPETELWMVGYFGGTVSHYRWAGAAVHCHSACDEQKTHPSLCGNV